MPAAALRTAASDHNGDAPFADLRWIEDSHE
jgi:hypothetical protein